MTTEAHGFDPEFDIEEQKLEIREQQRTLREDMFVIQQTLANPNLTTEERLEWEEQGLFLMRQHNDLDEEVESLDADLMEAQKAALPHEATGTNGEFPLGLAILVGAAMVLILLAVSQ